MRSMKAFAAILLTFMIVAPSEAQITLRGIGGSKNKREEKTKSIHGLVEDQRGKPISGARVLIRNTKDNTTRTLTTDAAGTYAIKGLPPNVNYEVRADFKGAVSDRKAVSALLDREDNLLNFQLDIAIIEGGSAPDSGPELQTFDLVKLRASFSMPIGIPAPIPSVLLLHGYGEDRKVWEGFKSQLLTQGFAVMSLDLRGHGESKTKNQRPLAPTLDWRSSSHEFPQDIAPALDWLKKQPRLDSHKIVVIGYDIGANLALVSSGKFTEVRTVVAVKPTVKEALEMAGSAQDFRPHSALVVTPDSAEATQIKTYTRDPFQTLNQPVTGGTSQVFQSKALTDAIFQWLKTTY